MYCRPAKSWTLSSFNYYFLAVSNQVGQGSTCPHTYPNIKSVFISFLLSLVRRGPYAAVTRRLLDRQSRQVEQETRS